MRNLNFFSSLMFLLILTTSCGQDKMAREPSTEATSSLTSSGSSVGTCKMINGGNLGGCCSSHGGAKNCTTGMYQFNSSNSLICTDGTISPTCKAAN